MCDRDDTSGNPISKRPHHLTYSPIIKQMPAICSNELAAVEFLEQQRWGDCPACVHCGSVTVFKLMDAKTGGRNKRFLWKCRDCKKQFTVRIGMVCEESRIALRHWVYAFWQMSVSKKGVSALQIMRQTGISYKASLFLLHRIRHAMAAPADAPKLTGICEADETYVGGKPRHKSKEQLAKGGRKKTSHMGRGTSKQPVFAVVQRGGNVRTKVVADVTGKTLRTALHEFVDRRSQVMTDEYVAYIGIGRQFAGHETVNHKIHEYVRGEAHTNTIEGFFGIFKRCVIGAWHSISKEHMHRYLAEAEFRYNARHMNDGERTVAAIRSAEGKRLWYREPEPTMEWPESLFD